MYFQFDIFGLTLLLRHHKNVYNNIAVILITEEPSASIILPVKIQTNSHLSSHSAIVFSLSVSINDKTVFFFQDTYVIKPFTPGFLKWTRQSLIGEK